MAENQDFHNKSGMLAFLGSIVFVTVFFIYMVSLNKGVDLGEKIEFPPSSDVPVYDLASEKEPWVSNENIVKAGAKIYKQNCASCHGEKGDLVGGVPNARNLVDGKWTQGEGMISHFKALQNGIKDAQGNQTAMVSFSAQLKPFERWAVLNFIETITNNKSKDTPEDIANFAQTAQ
jgi:mono/diheme cytochrome c family protein